MWFSHWELKLFYLQVKYLGTWGAGVGGLERHVFPKHRLSFYTSLQCLKSHEQSLASQVVAGAALKPKSTPIFKKIIACSK